MKIPPKPPVDDWERPTTGSTATPGMTTWIMLAVLAWGALLALGSFLFGGNLPLVRAAIVFGVTLAFLLLWLVALALRQRREAEYDDEEYPAPDAPDTKPR
jgi:high-affinity Fe2+/Pb2+ permease